MACFNFAQPKTVVLGALSVFLLRYLFLKMMPCFLSLPWFPLLLVYMCTLTMYPVFIGVQVAHLLLLYCMYYFSHFIVFIVWSLPLDYFLFISARILVSLITLSRSPFFEFSGRR